LKVKIAYTIDLEEVPKELYKFLQDGRVHELSKIYENITENIKECNNEKAIADIHELRLLLAKIDQKLDDAHSILDGYMRACYGSKVEEESTNVQEE
jgi:hypothetical protein